MTISIEMFKVINQVCNVSNELEPYEESKKEEEGINDDDEILFGVNLSLEERNESYS